MSENVFNVLQMGAQAGTFDAPGSAAAATLLYPIEEPVSFELDRGSAISKQDQGRNVRNSASAGYHGVRSGSTTLPSQVRFQDTMDILEMIYAGGVTPTDLGGGLYEWVYPFEAGAPTIVPRTLEGGNIDVSQAQMRLVSSLVSSLTIGFPAISVPGASPWTLSADIVAFNREISALTTAGAGTDEVQTITIDATGGTWIATFNGESTAPLAFDITGANLQVALRALTTINGANVTVTGDGPYVVTFIASLAATNVSLITTNAAGLTGGAGTAVVVETTPGVGATAVAARSGLEVVQGHLTRLYEGTTATAFASLSEIAGSLKSYTQTAERNLVPRAYGSASDVPTKFGFTEQSNGTFESMVAVNATSKSDFHDIWNVAAPAPLGERRWRLKALGNNGSHYFQIDARVAILAVPYDEHDGERLFKVSGEFVDDSTLGASHTITIVNGVSGL
jgi:hypothetical protein